MTWREIATGRVPIRVWARHLDAGTLRQLAQLAERPYVTMHVAAMPDAHVSAGIAVGTVFATEHTVVPGALGGDLGCGMSARKLTNQPVDRKTLERLLEQMARAIPAGAGTHRAPIAVPDALRDAPLSTGNLEHTRDALVGRHLGTLGGGNHFVELDRDARGNLWLLVHSGSRGLGGAIASHHGRAAGDPLDGLDVRTQGAAYLADLDWALTFARANRTALARRATEVFAEVTGLEPDDDAGLDVHHNFVSREEWFGRELWIHRKGAVAAPAGAQVLVPGSMGTASWVVTGRGCAAAFGSCSHGAGRVLSRSAARAAVTPRALQRAMHGVVYPAHLARSLVEEAPAAYRDVEAVLDEQTDLVERHTRLRPVAVLKG